MLQPYRELFKAPGSAGFAMAGFLARLPISMTGIGLITMLALLHGSYALAGAVAATFVLTTALLAPQISRLVDRQGQARILPLAACISVSGMLALLLCAYLDAPTWTLFVFAVLAGCMPSMPAMVRARWTHIYRGRPQLQTAYALESVLDEMCFIIGPPVSVGLSVAWFPEAGPLLAAILLGVGVTAFVLQRATQPPVYAPTRGDAGSVVRIAGVRILMLLLMAMGVIVGTIDVGAVAFAQQQGQPTAASIVLSVYAIGSCLAGMVFGAITLKTPLPRLFLYGGIATAVTTLLLLFANDVAGLSLAVLVAGLFFAPTLIVAMALVERMVPATKLTEGMTWLITGLGIGVALGGAVVGQIVDKYGVQAGFGVGVAAGFVVLLVVVLGYRRVHAGAMVERPAA